MVNLHQSCLNQHVFFPILVTFQIPMFDYIPVADPGFPIGGRGPVRGGVDP